jgi:hypothetical protein
MIEECKYGNKNECVMCVMVCDGRVAGSTAGLGHVILCDRHLLCDSWAMSGVGEAACDKDGLEAWTVMTDCSSRGGETAFPLRGLGAMIEDKKYV